MTPVQKSFTPIPRCRFGLPLQHRRIAAAMACTVSTADVAYLFQVTQDTVRTWRRKYLQGDL